MIGLLAAGATLLGGAMQSRSADRATRAAQENNQAAIDAQERAARAAEARLREGTEGAIGAYEAYGNRQLDALSGGYRGAAQSIMGGNRGARQIIRDGAREQIAGQNRTFNRQRGYLNPMIQSGDAARDVYDFEMGIGGRPNGYRGYEMSPDYQFRMDQGLDAVQSSAAAGGGLFSGATMRAMNDYAQGVAAQGRGEYMDRLNGVASQGAQSRNYLAQLDGMRGAANSQVRGATANTLAGYRNQMGQQLAQLGQARTNNTVNVLGDMGRGIGGAYETLGTGLASNATRLGANQAAGLNNAGNIAAAGAVAQGNVFNNTLNQGAQLFGYGQQQGWWGNNPGGGTMNANQLMNATVGAMGGPAATTVRAV